jgi:hypothetical protein
VVTVDSRVGQPTPAERRGETADEKLTRCRAEIVEVLRELSSLYSLHACGHQALDEALDRLSAPQTIDSAARLRTVANRLLGRGPSV